MNHHKFKRCGKDVDQIVGRLIKAFYADTLGKVRPRIDALFCFAAKDEAGNPTGPALKHNGHPAAGTIRIVPLRERALGLGDALLCLDGELWPDLSKEQRDALVDHELMHLIPKRLEGAEAGFKLDDLDRPMFKMREHDVTMGWFIAIAARHGVASIEVQQAVMLRKNHGQLLFDFQEPEQAALHIVDELIPVSA